MLGLCVFGWLLLSSVCHFKNESRTMIPQQQVFVILFSLSFILLAQLLPASCTLTCSDNTLAGCSLTNANLLFQVNQHKNCERNSQRHRQWHNQLQNCCEFISCCLCWEERWEDSWQSQGYFQTIKKTKQMSFQMEHQDFQRWVGCNWGNTEEISKDSWST